MNKILKLLGGVSAVCLLVASSPASAVTMQAVYTGFITNSTSLTDMFGLPAGAGALDNQSYSLTFIYNPSRLGVFHDNTAESQVARGGSFDPLSSISPIYNAELIINGISQFFTSNAAGYVGNFNAPSGYNSTFHSAQYQSFDSNYIYESYVSSGIGNTNLSIPLGLEAPYHVVVDGLSSNGQFDFSVLDSLADYTIHTSGDLTATELTVTTIPLPATLPLLTVGISGLALITGRSRKRKSA